MKKKVIVYSVIVLLLVITGAASYFIFKVYLPKKHKVQSGEISEINRKVWRAIVEDILIEPLLITSSTKGGVPDYVARMPLRYTPDKLRNIFGAIVSGYENATMKYSETDSLVLKSSDIAIQYLGKDIFRVQFTRNNKPKIAIILDDWGYNNRNFHYIEDIAEPFTAAVLPGHVYSKKASVALTKGKKAIILHLPMQPKRDMPAEKNTVKVDMDASDIAEICKVQIESVPGARGVNNHQGSLATEDPAVMDAILNVIKDKGMFFIDSLTSRKSIGLAMAQEKGVLTNRRNIFIDNEKYLDYIEGQFLQLKRVAKKNGYAIGIGHDNDVTLQALELYMPALENEGFEFVYVAELVE